MVEDPGGLSHIKYHNMEVIAALLGAQGCGVSITTGSTGNLTRKRRDITEQMLKAAENPFGMASLLTCLSCCLKIVCMAACVWERLTTTLSINISYASL